MTWRCKSSGDLDGRDSQRSGKGCRCEAVERMMASWERFLQKKLRLKINRDEGAAARPMHEAVPNAWLRPQGLVSFVQEHRRLVRSA